MKTSVFFLLLFMLWFIKPGIAQDTSAVHDQGFEKSDISLNVFVRQSEVPQNRFAELILRLEWTGDLDRYEIHPFDNPILQNFEIQGSGSANRVETINGLSKAIREYTFTLKPEAMGMGYVESFIVKYTDLQTDTDYHLTSNRIPIEVVEPVREPGSNRWLIWLAVFLLFFGAGFLGIRALIRKQQIKAKQEQENAAKAIPLEEKYLQQLKESINLNDPALDGVKAVSQLSRLLHQFLQERYQSPGLEATTRELVEWLRQNDFEERVANEINDILGRADTVKFSASQVTPTDVEQTYTRVQALFHASFDGELQKKEQSDESQQSSE